MDAMIRDQIVYGTNDEKLRERLLRDTTLNLVKAEQAAKAAEATAAQQKVWARDESHIDAMRKEHPSKQSELPRHYKCPKCARMHPPRRCPAFGKTCRKCQRPNHFAICCRRFADIGELQGGEDNFDILDVSSCAPKQHDWTVVGQIKNVPLEFKVDTGAQANLLPFGCYRKIRPKPPLKPSSAVLRSYGGGVIKHDGVIRAELALGDRCAVLDFFVVSKGHQAILGLQASENLGLVSRIHAVSRNSSEEVARNFRHLFTGTGRVERVYRMVLRDDATPIVQAARRVPLALQEPLREELGRMERAGIITKVTEPTDWKAIGDMPPRLQRFFLRLLRYDVKLQFTPGKQLLLADMLSRATTGPITGNDVINDDTEVHAVSVVSSLVTDNTWKRLATETSRDEELKQVLVDLAAGKALQGHWKSFEGELSHVNGVLLKGCKVVIPATMRKETLERIHQGHLGINKCKSRARHLVFWPGINRDIETFAQACSACKTYAYRQPQEPLQLRPVPDKPWHRVGIDIFEHGGRSYLCVYDALSNFPEVELLKDTTAKTVIEATSAIFARYGIPVEVC
ncbi:uncharacterized protein [Dermacentor albipictus]|uniref:uncharacterized protein n=1 Tax=Dermacentor albipictus TaxID=60249 RepID=UPI0038FC74A0